MGGRIEAARFLGWVFYDGECPMCLSPALRLAAGLRRRGFRLMPLQADWVQEKLQLDSAEMMREMKVLTADGSVLGGADAVLHIFHEYWWLRPVNWLAFFPGVLFFYRLIYRWIAGNRYCLSGSCPLPHKRRQPPLFSVSILLGLSLCSGFFLKPWIFMWTVCFALFFSLKWLCFWRAERLHLHASLVRKFVFLFLWPGMSVQRFFNRQKKYALPTTQECAFAICKYVFGCWLLWCLTPIWSGPWPYFAAWIGLVGFSFVLHFGIFHLLSICWRYFGYHTQPIMNAPICATSVGRFWGLRWNLAFRDTAYPFIFVPLHQRVGKTGALLLTFFVSGLVHELVVSLPARGGFGLPTLYFMLQAGAILIERSSLGKHLGLRNGIAGWLFVFLFTAIPVLFLFHPPFINNIVIPFLQALNAW